ncbi:MAG: mannose-6-phosphate isomerase, type 2 [Parcubacteria group bacterium]|nr:mannose-6-phosphate isomerase, type 2 [Parcubacteria group bacterium]
MNLDTYHEDRPWGGFDQFIHNEPCTVKILTVHPEKRFSLQKHSRRSEFWQVIEGSGTVHIGDVEKEVSVGDRIEIPVDTLHRLTGGPAGIKVLEIARGEFDENDIERVEDDFGRIT